jgi:hypothetical protein
MVHGLGRWLRAAGYDTVIAKGGIPDRELARRCAGEEAAGPVPGLRAGPLRAAWSWLKQTI